MTTLNKVLIGALVAQLAAVAVTWRPSSGGSSEPVDLLGFPSESITKITVTGRLSRDEVPEPPVVLSKSADGWVLDSSDGYPATEANVKPLLESLDKLHAVRDPIAHRAEDYFLLEVADDRYTRKVDVVAADGATKTLYFGAAKGQNAHVRLGGDSAVYDVRGTSAWSLAEHDNRYFERDFLKVNPTVLQSVRFERPGQAPMTLTQADGKWIADPTPPGKEVDQTAARTFAQSTLNVRMLEPGGKAITPEMGLDGAAAATVTWVALDPNGGAPATHSYVVGAAIPEEVGRLWMKSTTSPHVIKVLKGTVLHAIEKPYDILFTDAAPAAPPVPLIS